MNTIDTLILGFGVWAVRFWMVNGNTGKGDVLFRIFFQFSQVGSCMMLINFVRELVEFIK